MARKLDSRDNQQPSVKSTAEPTPGERRDSSISRRTYLGLGATVIRALRGNVTGAPINPISRYGIDFHSARDAIDDLGMDPTGEEPIDQKLKETEDGVLIQFPNGTYRLDGDSGTSMQNETRGFEGVGSEATFQASRDSDGFLLDANEMEAVYFSNIGLDQRPRRSCVGIRLTGNRIICRDVELFGDCDTPAGGVPLLSHATTSSTGQSLIEGIDAASECRNRPALGRPGIFVEPSHSGSLLVRDCVLEQFPDAAVHATRHSGSVRVLDSQFKNNAAGIHLTRPSSQIRRSEIVVDEIPSTVEVPSATSPFRLHGIAVGSANVETDSDDPVVVSNSRVQIEDLRSDFPAIVTVSPNTSVEVADCEVVFNNDGQSVVKATTPGQQFDQSVGALHVRNSVVRGSGTVGSILCVENADGSEVTNSSLQLSGGDGITIRESEACSIAHTNIAVPGYAGVFGSSSVTAVGIEDSRLHCLRPDSKPLVAKQNAAATDDTRSTALNTITRDSRLGPNWAKLAKQSVPEKTTEGVIPSSVTEDAAGAELADGRPALRRRFGDQGDRNNPDREYPHWLMVDNGFSEDTYGFSAPTLSPNRGRVEKITGPSGASFDSYRFAGTLGAVTLDGTGALFFSRTSTDRKSLTKRVERRTGSSATR